MKQTCGVCGKEIETGGMGGAPMCEHYKWKHPIQFFGGRENIPAKYLQTVSKRSAVHPNPGERSELSDFS